MALRGGKIAVFQKERRWKVNSQLAYVVGGILFVVGLFVWFGGPHSLLWGVVLVAAGLYVAYAYGYNVKPVPKGKK